jgi:HAD superfamily hydrolase (TIGR01509 family)
VAENLSQPEPCDPRTSAFPSADDGPPGEVDEGSVSRSDAGRFDAVLFDAGDTLIRLSGSGETLLHRAAAGLGADPLDQAAVHRVWRRVLARSSTADELAKGRDLSRDRHREVWTELYRAAGCEGLVAGLSDALYALTVCAESWEAFPDAVPTLAALRDRGLRVGVVSDTGFDLRPALDRLGLSRYLSAVVMSFQYGVCKPAASVFRTACDQLGVPPERTLMVGDNPLTDSGAVTAGMYVFLLPPPPKTGPRGLRHVLSLI